MVAYKQDIYVTKYISNGHYLPTRASSSKKEVPDDDEIGLELTKVNDIIADTSSNGAHRATLKTTNSQENVELRTFENKVRFEYNNLNIIIQQTIFSTKYLSCKILKYLLSFRFNVFGYRVFSSCIMVCLFENVFSYL